MDGLGVSLVGTIGSLAGLLMGYGVARGLGRSVLRAEGLAEVGQNRRRHGPWGTEEPPDGD